MVERCYPAIYQPGAKETPGAKWLFQYSHTFTGSRQRLPPIDQAFRVPPDCDLSQFIQSHGRPPWGSLRQPDSHNNQIPIEIDEIAHNTVFVRPCLKDAAAVVPLFGTSRRLGPDKSWWVESGNNMSFSLRCDKDYVNTIVISDILDNTKLLPYLTRLTEDEFSQRFQPPPNRPTPSSREEAQPPSPTFTCGLGGTQAGYSGV